MPSSIWTETAEERLNRIRRKVRKSYLQYEKDLISAAQKLGALNKEIKDIDRELWELKLNKKKEEKSNAK